jgi:hypothetical protein
MLSYLDSLLYFVILKDTLGWVLCVKLLLYLFFTEGLLLTVFTYTQLLLLERPILLLFVEWIIEYEPLESLISSFSSSIYLYIERGLWLLLVLFTLLLLNFKNLELFMSLEFASKLFALTLLLFSSLEEFSLDFSLYSYDLLYESELFWPCLLDLSKSIVLYDSLMLMYILGLWTAILTSFYFLFRG